MGILSVPTEECLTPAESGLSVSSLGYSTCRGQISVNETAWPHSEMCTCVFFLSERETMSFCVTLVGLVFAVYPRLALNPWQFSV